MKHIIGVDISWRPSEQIWVTLEEGAQPVVLVLVILNAVVLTAQAFSSFALSAANGPTLPRKTSDCFRAWGDHVLFALSIVFT